MGTFVEARFALNSEGVPSKEWHTEGAAFITERYMVLHTPYDVTPAQVKGSQRFTLTVEPGKAVIALQETTDGDPFGRRGVAPIWEHVLTVDDPGSVFYMPPSLNWRHGNTVTHVLGDLRLITDDSKDAFASIPPSSTLHSPVT